MRPAKFDYFRPATLTEAATLLAESEGDGRILAGGQSLLPAMNLRLSKPSRLIDISNLSDLSAISVGSDSVRMGALSRHAQIIADPRLHEVFPIFREAGRWIAHATIREHGTIGGSLALADPAAEWATVLSLLGARIHAFSVRGSRSLRVEDFFISYYTTALEADELIVEIEIPLPKNPVLYGFTEFSRQAGAFALAMVAVSMEVGASEQPENLQAWLGACGAKPMRLVMNGVTGAKPSSAAIDKAFDAMNVSPSGDIHAAADDRREIAKALLHRCVAATGARFGKGG